MGLQITAALRDWKARARSAARRNRRLLAAALLIGGYPACAHADESTDEDYHLSIGPGTYTAPRYPGASNSRTRLFPFIDAEYHDRYYTSASDLFGVYGYKSDTAHAGAAIELDPTRRYSRHDARLGRLPDVKDTTRLKLFADRTVLFMTADGSIATDMLGRGQGSLAQANLWFTVPLNPGLSINAGPGATWADMRYMRSFYAVTPWEAAGSPSLTAHATHAGILDTHMNALVEWQFLTHYRIGAQAYLARLEGNAATSPVVLRRTQRSLVGWIAYKFR